MSSITGERIQGADECPELMIEEDVCLEIPMMRPLKKSTWP